LANGRNAIGFCFSKSNTVANKFVTLFQNLAAELKEKQPEALDKIIAGHEAMLMSPPIPVKETIPIATQQWVELRWDSQLRPIRRPPKRDADAIPRWTWVDTVVMVDLIPAIVERLYRDLASAKAPQPACVNTTAKKITLTKADVDAILQRTRSATPEELEYVIAHAKEFILTDGQRDQVCCDLTIAAAQRARQGNGRRIDGNAEFISKVLGLIDTPFGLIARSFVDDLLRDGSRNISRCRLHRPPNCDCWSAQRAMLFQASANGESPEGWVATRIRAALEQLEVSTRPEGGPGIQAR
jgi:hypothetical protein